MPVPETDKTENSGWPLTGVWYRLLIIVGFVWSNEDAGSQSGPSVRVCTANVLVRQVGRPVGRCPTWGQLVQQVDIEAK